METIQQRIEKATRIVEPPTTDPNASPFVASVDAILEKQASTLCLILRATTLLFETNQDPQTFVAFIERLARVALHDNHRARRMLHGKDDEEDPPSQRLCMLTPADKKKDKEALEAQLWFEAVSRLVQATAPGTPPLSPSSSSSTWCSPQHLFNSPVDASPI